MAARSLMTRMSLQIGCGHQLGDFASVSRRQTGALQGCRDKCAELFSADQDWFVIR
jgi:hypothetical protein